jgi:hypothetical protein
VKSLWAIFVALIALALLFVGGLMWWITLYTGLVAASFFAPGLIAGVAAIGLFVLPDKWKAFAAIGLFGVSMMFFAVGGFMRQWGLPHGNH